MEAEHRDRFALEVSPASVGAIAAAVLAIVDEDLHEIAVAHVNAELARRAGGQPRPGLLSVGELAVLLGVHQRTIYRALSSGRLTGVRVGAAWRVRHEDLEAWLSEQDKRRPLPPPGPRRPDAPAQSFRARLPKRGQSR